MKFSEDGTLIEPCGFAAYCGRPLGHGTHHGGWRTRIVAWPDDHDWTPHDPGTEFSLREVQVLAEYAEHGRMAEVARCLGISLQTVKNHITTIHERASVATTVQVFRALGWLRVPRGTLRHAS